MKSLLLVFMCVGLSACGKVGTIEHEGTINATVSLNKDQLEKYFKLSCAQKIHEQLVTAGAANTTPSDSDVQACVDLSIGNFLLALTDLSQPQQVPQ